MLGAVGRDKDEPKPPPPVFDPPSPSGSKTLQSLWGERLKRGSALGPMPSGSSSRARDTPFLFSGLKHVNEILREIGLRSTLRRQARYEKPAAKRVRLRSERHRRRFAARVGDGVAAVMSAKSRGM